MAHILVADDDAAHRFLFCRILALNGYTSVEAKNGLDVCTIVRRTPCDLILLDLDMPELNGWQATEWVRNYKPTAKIPIVAMTAHMIDGDGERAIAAGCNAYVQKPIMIPHLLDVIRELLDSQEGTVVSHYDQMS